VLLGGTGFIGSYTTEALLAQGYRVRVMARGARNLQAVFNHPAVEVVEATSRGAKTWSAPWLAPTM